MSVPGTTSVPGAGSEEETVVSLDLANVAACDHALVKDVAAVLASIFQSSVSAGLESLRVSCNGQVYFVIGSLAKGAVAEISKSDLDTISDVNPLRVTASSILYDGERVHVKVRVSSFDHPLTITDTQLVRVVKKRRWGIF